MYPPEMRDIDLEHYRNKERGAGKDDQLDREGDSQMSNSSQKRKRLEGPSTPLLTPKKKLCSEAKIKDLEEEVPVPVQANPDDDVKSDANKAKMPLSKTRTLTRRTLPSRNVVQDIEKNSTENKRTKFSVVDILAMEKPVKTIKDKESPSSSKHLQPYVLLPLLSLKASESQPMEGLKAIESQQTEEISMQPTLQSRTRSRKAKVTEELPPQNQDEEVANARRSKSTRSRVSIPANLSEKVSDEKDEEEKVSDEKDEQEKVSDEKDEKEKVSDENESEKLSDKKVSDEEEKVSDEKDEGEKVSDQKDEEEKQSDELVTANKDEPSIVMERNAGQERVPLLGRRRREVLRDTKAATTVKTATTVTKASAAKKGSYESKAATTVKKDASATTVTTATTSKSNQPSSEKNQDEVDVVSRRFRTRDPKAATTAAMATTSSAAKIVSSESNQPSSQRNRDEVDVVSRRFRTRATELEPAKEESLKSNLGKRRGRQSRKEETSKAERNVKPLNLSTTSKLEQSEPSSPAIKTPEVAADISLEREKKPAIKEGRQSRTCRSSGAAIQSAKTTSHRPEISRQEEGNAESLPKRSLANLSSAAVPQMVRLAEGRRIVVILNKALIAEAKKSYRQLNPRVSLKRLTKRVGRMENEMKRLIARNELRGRLTFLLQIDLKQHEVSCMEVMKKPQVTPVAIHVVENGLEDGTQERRSKEESSSGALERRRGRSSSRRGEVTPSQKKPEVTNSTTRTAQTRPKKKQGSTKERIGRSGVCATKKKQEERNNQEEEDGGEMDLFYQICPLRPCSLTKGGPGQSCGRRGVRRGSKIQQDKKMSSSDKSRKDTSLWQLARCPTNLRRGKLLALHAFTYDGSGVNLWDDDDDDDEEEVRLKRAWRSTTPNQPPILSDLTNKGGKVSKIAMRFTLNASFCFLMQVQFPPRKKPDQIWRNSAFNSRIKTMISRWISTGST